MAIRKIVLRNCDCCPICGGKSGIKFALRSYVKCINQWGSYPQQSEHIGVDLVNNSTKTARCIDCDRVFEII